MTQQKFNFAGPVVKYSLFHINSLTNNGLVAGSLCGS